MKAKHINLYNDEERIDHIAYLIRKYKRDPKIISLARKLIKRCPRKDYMCELESIFDWIIENCRYSYDVYGVDVYMSPVRLIEDMDCVGDCDDFTVLIGSLTSAIGYPVRLKIISQDGYNYTHIYPLIGVPPYNPSQWVALDVTLHPPQFGTEPPRYKKARVFEVKP